MRRLRAAGLAFTALAAAATPAGAERLITSLSTHQVMITSNFTGTDIVLFGSIERDAATVSRRGGYDIVVTVTGPRQEMVTRKKDRILGIWANAESQTFVAPSYLAALSNKAPDTIGGPELLARLQVGLANAIGPRPGARPPDISALPAGDAFRDAFLRLKKEHGLYRDLPDAVTFLAPSLFRANIPLPAVAPLGTYEVDVKLFADGTNIARTTSALEIVKVGFEQFVANAARDYGLLYGLATTFMALATGWFASVIFRRD